MKARLNTALAWVAAAIVVVLVGTSPLLDGPDDSTIDRLVAADLAATPQEVRA